MFFYCIFIIEVHREIEIILGEKLLVRRVYEIIVILK